MPSPSERRQASKPHVDGVAQARRLRSKMSLPEVLLWQLLRRRGTGDLRFRRQRPIGPYVVDFYCHEALQVVEVDGKQHHGRAEHEQDIVRDHWLRGNGYAVFRIPAAVVLQDPAGAAESVLRETMKRLARMGAGLTERQRPPSG